MSSMAKIFVVVNLVLAVCVFGAAAVLLGAQDDYKMAHQKTLTQFDDYKKAQDDALEAKDRQITQLAQARGEAVASATQAKAETETHRTQLEKSRATDTTQRATIESLSQSLEGLRTQLKDNSEQMRKMSDAAQESTQNMLSWKNKYEEELQNRNRLEVELSNSQDMIQSLSAQKGDLERQVRQQKFELGEYAKKFGTLISGNRGSNGRVMAVKSLNNGVLVSISVGKEDGVRDGDTYNIRRGTNYIGSIRIDSVMRGQAVGIFDTKYTGGNGNPDVGDIAYAAR